MITRGDWLMILQRIRDGKWLKDIARELGVHPRQVLRLAAGATLRFESDPKRDLEPGRKAAGKGAFLRQHPGIFPDDSLLGGERGGCGSRLRGDHRTCGFPGGCTNSFFRSPEIVRQPSSIETLVSSFLTWGNSAVTRYARSFSATLTVGAPIIVIG